MQQPQTRAPLVLVTLAQLISIAFPSSTQTKVQKGKVRTTSSSPSSPHTPGPPPGSPPPRRRGSKKKHPKKLTSSPSSPSSPSGGATQPSSSGTLRSALDRAKGLKRALKKPATEPRPSSKNKKQQQQSPPRKVDSVRRPPGGSSSSNGGGGGARRNKGREEVKDKEFKKEAATNKDMSRTGPTKGNKAGKAGTRGGGLEPPLHTGHNLSVSAPNPITITPPSNPSSSSFSSGFLPSVSGGVGGGEDRGRGGGRGNNRDGGGKRRLPLVAGDRGGGAGGEVQRKGQLRLLKMKTHKQSSAQRPQHLNTGAKQTPAPPPPRKPLPPSSGLEALPKRGAAAGGGAARDAAAAEAKKNKKKRSKARPRASSQGSSSSSSSSSSSKGPFPGVDASALQRRLMEVEGLLRLPLVTEEDLSEASRVVGQGQRLLEELKRRSAALGVLQGTLFQDLLAYLNLWAFQKQQQQQQEEEQQEQQKQKNRKKQKKTGKAGSGGTAAGGGVQGEEEGGSGGGGTAPLPVERQLYVDRSARGGGSSLLGKIPKEDGRRLVREVGELRSLVRIKVEDDNDLNLVRQALREAVQFFDDVTKLRKKGGEALKQKTNAELLKMLRELPFS